MSVAAIDFSSPLFDLDHEGPVEPITEETRRRARDIRLVFKTLSERRRAEPHRLTWIYCIQAGERGPVKIGLARNPLERLATLQQGNPEPLRGVWVWQGLPEEERFMHDVCAEWRIRGEWFQPTEEVRAAVAFLGDPFEGAFGEWDEE